VLLEQQPGHALCLRPTISFTGICLIGPSGTERRKEADIGPMPILSESFEVTRDGAIVWVHFEQGRRELWMMEIEDR